MASTRGCSYVLVTRFRIGERERERETETETETERENNIQFNHSVASTRHAAAARQHDSQAAHLPFWHDLASLVITRPPWEY